MQPCASFLLAQLNPVWFADWAYARLTSHQPSSVRRELMVVQAALTHGRKVLKFPLEDKLLEAAFSVIPTAHGRERRLSADEEQRLLTAADQYGGDIPSIIRLALETGMRRGEIIPLRWGDVDFTEKTITLRAGKTKNSDARIVPLTQAAEELLRGLHHESPPNARVFPEITKPDSATRAFTRLCERAGITNLRFHDLRHEAASRVAPYASMASLQKIFGWKSPSMVWRYNNPSAAELLKIRRDAERSRLAETRVAHQEERV
ncbi:hypothetical protein CCAE64S_01461 [Castellaniella caeni]